MFDRQKYKRFARVQLKNRWGIPVVITLIATIITSLFSIPDLLNIYSSDAFLDFIRNPTEQSLQGFSAAMEVSSGSASLIFSLLEIAVSAILTVAALNVYINMTRSPEKVSFSLFLEGFNNWGRAILASLWQFLWIFLWSLLFIIPGIIKSIAYSQIYYIIAENENVSVTKALRISSVITKGHKWDLFVMGLSFLGWIFLAALTCGIGTLFLEPYMKLSFLNAYHGMMKEAIETGKIRPEDLSE